MKHATEYLTFETPHRRDYLNITDRVEAFVRQSGIHHGLVLVNPMHITAAVYVDDDERGLIADIHHWLKRRAPPDPGSGPRHPRRDTGRIAELDPENPAPEVPAAVGEAGQHPGRQEVAVTGSVVDLQQCSVRDRRGGREDCEEEAHGRSTLGCPRWRSVKTP